MAKLSWLLTILLFCAWRPFNLVDQFTVGMEDAAVRLDWSVGEEAGIQSFRVYKKRPAEGTFSHIGSVSPTGLKQYFFLDDDLYRNAEAGTIEYRLTVQGSGGTTHYFGEINYAPTTLQRSWGSIKSMFQ